MLSEPWLEPPPDASGVAGFLPGPGVERLDAVSVDLAELQAALDQVLGRLSYDETFGEWGFGDSPRRDLRGSSS